MATATYTIIHADDFLVLCVPDGTPIIEALLDRFDSLTDGDLTNERIGELMRSFEDAETVTGCTLTDIAEEDDPTVIYDSEASGGTLTGEDGRKWMFACKAD